MGIYLCWKRRIRPARTLRNESGPVLDLRCRARTRQLEGPSRLVACRLGRDRRGLRLQPGWQRVHALRQERFHEEGWRARQTTEVRSQEVEADAAAKPAQAPQEGRSAEPHNASSPRIRPQAEILGVDQVIGHR